MHPYKGPTHIILFCAVVLVTMILPYHLQAKANIICLDCHENYYESQIKKTFIHKPFLEKKCPFCHSPDWVENAAQSDGKALLPRKTKKLGSDDNPALTHLFSLPKEYDLSTLFIEAQRDGVKPYKVKLRILPFEDLDTLSSDAHPPEITDVQVIEIKKGVLVSAKIRWHTDELSSSKISYGIKQPDDQSIFANQFLSDHTIELYPLEPDADYYFTITSEDIYGNTKESRIYSFKTDKNYKMALDSHLEKPAEPLQLKSEIFRSEDNYLIRISANQHIKLEISTYDLPNGSPLLKNYENLPKNHPEMRSIYETNVLLCDNCHQVLSDRFSHPVHFRARLGSNVPADYPRLPNGQISCLTCHDYHASNNAYHLRKSAERELCIGCHKRSFRN